MKHALHAAICLLLGAITFVAVRDTVRPVAARDAPTVSRARPTSSLRSRPADGARSTPNARSSTRRSISPSPNRATRSPMASVGASFGSSTRPPPRSASSAASAQLAAAAVYASLSRSPRVTP